MSELLSAMLVGHGALRPGIVFLAAGTLLFLIAARLTQQADRIAEITGAGRLWIGSLLLAGGTSLPEVATDVTAAVSGLPDIGVGDLFGSTLANMLIFAILTLFCAPRSFLKQATSSHALVGSLAIALTLMASLSIAAGGLALPMSGHEPGPGADTLLIVAIYILGMRILHARTQQAAIATHAHCELPVNASPSVSLWRSTAGFCLSALLLVLMVPLLVSSAESIAIETGTSNSFVGTVLVGLTTSLPEAAAAVTAVRMGQMDLALGNLFGSNAFNMSILALMDLGYADGPLLSAVSPLHVRSSLMASLAILLGLLALRAGRSGKTTISRLLAMLILVVFMLNIRLLS